MSEIVLAATVALGNVAPSLQASCTCYLALPL